MPTVCLTILSYVYEANYPMGIWLRILAALMAIAFGILTLVAAKHHWRYGELMMAASTFGGVFVGLVLANLFR